MKAKKYFFQANAIVKIIFVTFFFTKLLMAQTQDAMKISDIRIFSDQANASIIIKGKIVNVNDPKDKLIGATVYLEEIVQNNQVYSINEKTKYYSVGTLTDFDGNFDLKIDRHHDVFKSVHFDSEFTVVLNTSYTGYTHKSQYQKVVAAQQRVPMGNSMSPSKPKRIKNKSLGLMSEAKSEGEKYTVLFPWAIGEESDENPPLIIQNELLQSNVKNVFAMTTWKYSPLRYSVAQDKFYNDLQQQRSEVAMFTCFVDKKNRTVIQVSQALTKEGEIFDNPNDLQKNFYKKIEFEKISPHPTELPETVVTMYDKENDQCKTIKEENNYKLGYYYEDSYYATSGEAVNNGYEFCDGTVYKGKNLCDSRFVVKEACENLLALAQITCPIIKS